MPSNSDIITITNGQGLERRVLLEAGESIIGRANNVSITLEGANISRSHARLIRDGANLALEDLGSSNGTYLNGKRISGRVSLSPGDTIRIGGYSLCLEREVPEPAGDLTIQRQTLAVAANQDLYRENPAQKLQAVLELAHALANSLDVETLLNRFMEQVFKLLPKADRALVVFIEKGEPIARAVKDRRIGGGREKLFSRSLLKQVVEKGIGVLAEDVQAFDANMSLNAMGVRSVLCVPLRAHEIGVFGVVQLDRFRGGLGFTGEDLNLLTAVTLQVSMVLEKARLHERLILQERFARELALAREIQLAFLPREIPRLGNATLDLAADLQPAEEVSGDFYDYIKLDASRVALVVADVSGKGMPAALFMSMVRALLRQAVKNQKSPAAILTELNTALASDNPKFMFVTVILAIYNAETGDCALARGGHPAPILKRSDGTVEELTSNPGCLIGIEQEMPALQDSLVTLQPGETLVFYTDGISEAPQDKTLRLFGNERLLETLRQLPVAAPLTEWIISLKKQVADYCGPAGAQDDVTLLLLRHKGSRQ